MLLGHRRPVAAEATNVHGLLCVLKLLRNRVAAIAVDTVSIQRFYRLITLTRTGLTIFQRIWNCFVLLAMWNIISWRVNRTSAPERFAKPSARGNMGLVQVQCPPPFGYTMKRKATKNQLSLFWLENYLSKDSLCLLCSNKGMVTTYEGTTVPCLCPNGRAIDRAEKAAKKS